ncbi:TIGR00730 family Rossman fold protein [Luteibacter sp. PPL201]|uniref:Cytokinin riboside 5'-monophosphate phosphoribohydrolase n=1 Tax=Luteibacter sahnii TaxID=3021977 RepID=A0ABT6B870_9GAMM
MRNIQTLCVYCGSSSGVRAEYTDAAKAFGMRLAQDGITLVYGGGKVGLMGTVADAVLAAGGRVIGVIPRQLVEKEVAHTGLSQLQVVETMHERKTRMYELADAFVALPGGFGTMDEMFEMLTWAQLGLHAYPCAYLDVLGFYKGLSASMDHMVAEGFVKREQRDQVWFGDDIDALFHWMTHYESAYTPKWITPSAIDSHR